MVLNTPERAIERWPPIDRVLRVDGSVLGPVHCATRLQRSGLSYWHTLATLPVGYRISALEEVAYLLQEDVDVPRGVTGRESLAWSTLRDDFFADLLRAPEPLWEWTHACLRAPSGATDFRTYTERQQDRTYYRADYVLGEAVIAEGVLVPEGYGGKVVEWHNALRLPAVISRGAEPDHAAHFYFDPSNTEVAIILCRGHYADEHEPCLDLMALYRRSMRAHYCAYRLVAGALEDLGLSAVVAALGATRDVGPVV